MAFGGDVGTDLRDDRDPRGAVFVGELTTRFGLLDYLRWGRRRRVALRQAIGCGGEQKVEVAEGVALLRGLGHEVPGGPVVQLEHAQQPFGAPASVRIESVAVQQPRQGSDVPVPSQRRHPPGELGGETLHPNRDRSHRGWLSARGHARW